MDRVHAVDAEEPPILHLGRVPRAQAQVPYRWPLGQPPGGGTSTSRLAAAAAPRGWCATSTRAPGSSASPAPTPRWPPPAQQLLQAHTGVRPGEPLDAALQRLRVVLYAAFPGWLARLVWSRKAQLEAVAGAVDHPGTSWRDRPQIDREGACWSPPT
jgi:hypothetical protein